MVWLMSEPGVPALAVRVVELELRRDQIGAALSAEDRTALAWRIRGLREALELVTGEPAEATLARVSYPPRA